MLLALCPHLRFSPLGLRSLMRSWTGSHLWYLGRSFRSAVLRTHYHEHWALDAGGSPSECFTKGETPVGEYDMLVISMTNTPQEAVDL